MTERLRRLDPRKLIQDGSAVFYQRVPGGSPPASSPFKIQALKNYQWPSPRRSTEGFLPARFSPTRALWIALTSLLLFLLLIAGYGHRAAERQRAENEPKPLFWQLYPRLNGYYNGVRTLVPASEYVPENGYNKSAPIELISPSEANQLPKMPPLNPLPFNPYPRYESKDYLANHYKVEKCYLDEDEKVPAPDVYAYPGLPQNMSLPFFGSYENLGMEGNVCFDRYGRFGPYGYGYAVEDGGLGPGNKSEKAGSEKVYFQTGTINYTNIDWGTLQDDCYEKNRIRFEGSSVNKRMQKVQRHAFVLRIWEGYYFNEHNMYTLRAMINELSLKSGGEYDVHFLLHVKNNSIPVWADSEVYAQFVRDNMPQEFWNMTTLWSEGRISSYYPGPFGEAFENVAGQSIHGVYRSAHFALQWFAQENRGYDFYWNWEMDLRYTGHYYELNSRIGEWAKQQPRKGLWERNERFYIPELHGTWDNFTEMVERETRESGTTPIWGPVTFDNAGMLDPPAESFPKRSYDEDKYEWGVGEDADYISFNPIFDPAKTNWVFRNDISGYDLEKEKPPRRCAIITVARLSRKLLDIMHTETWKLRHSMFPEMWPTSVALHYGLKAVYAPHPVYFDRDWDLKYMDDVFNHPKEDWQSPFGWGEHNHLGSSFYYNSGFSGALWRRWLGQSENKEGGKKTEDGTTGRMCLRSTLHHPIKHELGPMD